LTPNNPSVIVPGMKRIWLLLPFIATLIMACSLTSNLSLLGPTPTPSTTPTITPIPPTPTPTFTPTPTPTPTPIPAERIGEGDAKRFLGDWQGALFEYQTALDNSPNTEIKSAALLGIGKTQHQAGDHQGAVDTLTSFIEIYPQSNLLAEVHFTLAEAYTNLDRHVEAADSYLNYLILRPGLIDAYILNLRGDALAAANNYGEALIDYRAALGAPSYLETMSIETKIARSHAAVGDYETALGIYQDLYNRSSSDYTRAQLDYLMGQAYLAAGQTDQAYAVYADAVNNYPTAYDSYTALIELVDAGVPVDELNRGIVDYYAGQYGVALAAIDRYFQAGAPNPAAAYYYNGLTTRALGGYEDAIANWDTIIQNYPDDRFWDDAWDQKAYTQWGFLNQYSQAIDTLLQFVEVAPNHVRAGEFLFDAAQVAERDGQLLRAAEIWERVFQEYPGYDEATQAIFQAGITRYRLGEYSAAFAIFQHVLANATTVDERSAAYFWQGKSQFALGDPGAAAANWELAANSDPTGYYSERARDILKDSQPFSPPQEFDLTVDWESERAHAENWLRSTFNLTPETDLSSPAELGNDARLQRGTELWNLGLYEEARLEFEDLRLAVQSDPINSYRLANYLYELGLYRSAILTTREILNLAQMSDAETMTAPPYFNHIRFGTYYRDLIVPSAQEYGLHPLFLFSVVRQESAFEGFVRSSAGARGLMQIMPATGQEIANDLGWPPDYSNEDLYRPVINVPLGAKYLADWRDRLAGNSNDPINTNLYVALAAYNGGPGNALEWQKLAPDDPDLFLEVVRYEETRNYIRSIYEIFNIYRRIYDRSP
jgi:soluble lytic murein transglycosylase